jgi:plastocyanin
MPRTSICVAAAALALAGAAGCGGDEETTMAAEPAAADAIEIVDFEFAPEEITVPAGTTITFTNQDSAAHTATADDSSFDTKELGKGDSAQATFEEPGTYTYYCRFHVFMKGTVEVK